MTPQQALEYVRANYATKSWAEMAAATGIPDIQDLWNNGALIGQEQKQQVDPNNPADAARYAEHLAARTYQNPSGGVTQYLTPQLTGEALDKSLDAQNLKNTPKTSVLPSSKAAVTTSSQSTPLAQPTLRDYSPLKPGENIESYYQRIGLSPTGQQLPPTTNNAPGASR